jgi:hypothetical protein
MKPEGREIGCSILLRRCSNAPQQWKCLSVPGLQLNIGPFGDFVKRIEAFPAAECAYKGLSRQSNISVGDFRHEMSASTTVNLLAIKIERIWSNAAHITECVEFFSEVQSETQTYQTITEYHNARKRPLISLTPIIPNKQL